MSNKVRLVVHVTVAFDWLFVLTEFHKTQLYFLNMSLTMQRCVLTRAKARLLYTDIFRLKLRISSSDEGEGMLTLEERQPLLRPLFRKKRKKRIGFCWKGGLDRIPQIRH